MFAPMRYYMVGFIAANNDKKIAFIAVKNGETVEQAALNQLPIDDIDLLYKKVDMGITPTFEPPFILGE